LQHERRDEISEQTESIRLLPNLGKQYLPFEPLRGFADEKLLDTADETRQIS
jgi:hypothetical protein